MKSAKYGAEVPAAVLGTKGLALFAKEALEWRETVEQCDRELDPVRNDMEDLKKELDECKK